MPDETTPDEPTPDARPDVALGTIAKEWARIGCTGFGGPPTHIAMLRRLAVEREGWLDETEFENPEEVDFDRANKRQMAFGLGPHRCIGSDVVRLEFRIMFEQILSRMPDFRVEEAGLRPSPVPAVVAGYEHVPFVFMPGEKIGGPRIVY